MKLSFFLCQEIGVCLSRAFREGQLHMAAMTYDESTCITLLGFIVV